jgi:RES domain-containing protein
VTVTAWRIVKARHAGNAFTGEGARLAGGRWNRPGTAVVYAAGSISLAMLELLIHLRSRELLLEYVLFEVTIPDHEIEVLDPSELPRGWRRSPPPRATQRIGDAWVASASSPVLRVPSVVVPSEPNFLLSPGHPRFPAIRIGRRQRIQLDRRLARGR